jgi:hypothetical protein
LHDAPDLQVELDLTSFLRGARGVVPPYVEGGVACAFNGEARTLEMSAQVVEQVGIAGS